MPQGASDATRSTSSSRYVPTCRLRSASRRPWGSPAGNRSAARRASASGARCAASAPAGRDTTSSPPLPVGQDRRVLAQRPTVLVNLRLDAEPQQEQLHLAQQFEAGAVQRDVVGLLAVMGHGSVGRKQPAEDGRLARPIQGENAIGQALFVTSPRPRRRTAASFRGSARRWSPRAAPVAVWATFGGRKRAAVFEGRAIAWSRRRSLEAGARRRPRPCRGSRTESLRPGRD